MNNHQSSIWTIINHQSSTWTSNIYHPHQYQRHHQHHQTSKGCMLDSGHTQLMFWRIIQFIFFQRSLNLSHVLIPNLILSLFWLTLSRELLYFSRGPLQNLPSSETQLPWMSLGEGILFLFIPAAGSWVGWWQSCTVNMLNAIGAFEFDMPRISHWL